MRRVVAGAAAALAIALAWSGVAALADTGGPGVTAPAVHARAGH